MTSPNPYAWLAERVAREFKATELSPKKPSLTVISAAQSAMKERNPVMTKTPDRESLKAELSGIIATTMPTATPHDTPLYRKLSSLKLVDHVGMVHNALEAVRCLAIPSTGTGVLSNGCQEDLAVLGRNHLVDLLEIINDRLGAALEIEEAKC